MARKVNRTLSVVVLMACGLLVAAAGVPASAAPDSVNGKFELANASGPDCSSSVGICMTGSVSGRIKGTFSFTATSLVPTLDTPTLGVIVTTGDATVDTRGGTIACKLTGTLQVTDEGPFVGLCVVTGGTGDWEGVTGYLRTTGTFTLGGGGTGSYDGRIAAL